MAELIRARLRRFDGQPQTDRRRQDPILKVAGVCRGPILSQGIDEVLHGG